MGLTQVSTDGVKNDAITKTKIPANQIEASELADNAVDTNAIANNAVTAGKLASGVQTTINNNADNRLITGSGTANTLNGESSITYDGTKVLNISSSAGGFFQGTDTDGGVGLIEMGNGNVAIQADTGNAIGSSKIHFFVDNTERMQIDSDGKLSTGGETAPDVSAGGLCLNQGTGDEKILTFKSSDIAHGVTTFDETDTFFSARKSSSNKGGVRLHGLTDAAGADPAFEFHGIIASDSDASYVPFEFRGHEANGTGTNNIAADRRIAKFTNSDGTIIAGFTGTGLTFGNDTATANSLSDYEEGTFTCTLTGSSSNPSYGTSSNAGFYVRIGKFVSLYYLMIINSVSSQGSGNWQIEGIPFSHSNSVNAYRSNGIIGYNDIFATEVNKLYVTNSDKLLIIPNGVTQSNQTYAQNALSTGYFSFSITYITDS